MSLMSVTGSTGPSFPVLTTETRAIAKRIAIGMAEEGVPIRAIARATHIAADDLRELLKEAMDAGTLVQYPREDWPVGASRNDRVPGDLTVAGLDDELLVMNVVRLFKVTKLQANLLLALIKRREVTRNTMHLIIEQRRDANSVETETKMVDVVICNLRKRLKPQNLKITTIWSCGYMMPPADRARAAKMLSAFVAGDESQAGPLPKTH